MRWTCRPMWAAAVVGLAGVVTVGAVAVARIPRLATTTGMTIVAVPPAALQPDAQQMAGLGATQVSLVPLPQSVATSSAAGVIQTLSVSVQGGGPLSVSPRSLTLRFPRGAHGSALRAALPTITLTDARGTLAGWTLTLSVHGVAGRVRVHPSAAQALTGRADEVRSSSVAVVGPSTRAVLMSAPPDGGGGEFAVGGWVELLGVPDARGDVVATVDLVAS